MSYGKQTTCQSRYCQVDKPDTSRRCINTYSVCTKSLKEHNACLPLIPGSGKAIVGTNANIGYNTLINQKQPFHYPGCTCIASGSNIYWQGNTRCCNVESFDTLNKIVTLTVCKIVKGCSHFRGNLIFRAALTPRSNRKYRQVQNRFTVYIPGCAVPYHPSTLCPGAPISR